MSKARLACFGAVLLALLVHSGGPLRAELRIDITGGTINPVPIAIPPFAGAGQAEAAAGRDIPAVVSADLGNSGLFRPIDPGSLAQSAAIPGAQPNFADWRQSGAQALVTGDETTLRDGRI
jgi:TolB protein